MEYRYKKEYKPIAQNLRKNMTKEEKHLWYDFLKKLPITVNRQKNIGEYIVDFYISKSKTVIEIDGSQHGEEEHCNSDQKRDKELLKLGIKVLRYTNKEINRNFNNVCEDILKKIGLSTEDLKE